MYCIQLKKLFPCKILIPIAKGKDKLESLFFNLKIGDETYTLWCSAHKLKFPINAHEHQFCGELSSVAYFKGKFILIKT